MKAEDKHTGVGVYSIKKNSLFGMKLKWRKQMAYINKQSALLAVHLKISKGEHAKN